jgi:GAF domain-containing protein
LDILQPNRLQIIHFNQAPGAQAAMMTHQKPSDENLKEQLQKLMIAIEAAGHAVLPQSNDALLKSIVETAARIFNAAAASIMLVNEAEKVLEFKVAFGKSNQDLVGTKIPMDKGIAGYVVMTGQPLTISNVRQDPRFNQAFAESTGYVPSSILATPLLVDDRVIGVMEVLDKINASSFGIQDMELLALFANQAALAIDQSQRIAQINDAVITGLKRLSHENGLSQFPDLLETLKQDGSLQSSAGLLAIADLFYELAALGEAQLKACIKVLQVFAEYQHATHRMWQ